MFVNSLLSHIKFIFSRLARKLIIILLSKLSVKLSANLFAFIIKKKSKKILNSNKKILFSYNRGAFSRDLKELKKSDHFDYLVVDMEYMVIIVGSIIPRYIAHHSFEGQHHILEDKNTEVIYFKEKITLFFEIFLKKLKKSVNIEGIFCCNFDVTFSYGLATAAQKIGLPFFVFYYENPTIPYVKDAVKGMYEEYEMKFHGDKLFLWHEFHKKLLLEYSFCNENEVDIIGAPRFDPWIEYNKKKSSQDTVTLLSYPGLEYFSPWNYIDVIQSVAKLSLKYQNINFVVKCKNDSHFIESKNFLEGMQHKLQLVVNTDMAELLHRSKIIIGHNSLSVLEGLFSDALLICPYWGDSKISKYLLQIDPDDLLAQKIFYFPSSRKDFLNLISSSLDGKIKTNGSRDERKKFMSRYFHFDYSQKSVSKIDKIMLSHMKND